MKTSYQPSRLIKAAAEIRKAHPNQAEIAGYQPDEAFLVRVRAWAQLSKAQAEEGAFLIPARDIRMLAKYIPENTLHLPLQRLCQMVALRANTGILRLLYLLWLDFFANRELCGLLCRITKEHPDQASQLVEPYPVSREEVLQWFASDDIPGTVGRTCMNLQQKKRLPFPERLQSVGVAPSSRLGQKCIEAFLTYCRREDYLALSDAELVRQIQHLPAEYMGAFLRKLLSVLETADFQRYERCGTFVRDKVDTVGGRLKYKINLSQLPPEHRRKYTRWMGYLELKESFAKDGSDERLVFWSRYVPYSVDVHRFRSSEALAIVFEHYYVIEFTLETMGALYVFDRGLFEEKFLLCTRYSNAEFRSVLYQNRDQAIERIIHHGDWQFRTRALLTRLGVMD